MVDYSLGTVEGGGSIRGINGNRKYTIKNKSKNNKNKIIVD